MAHSGTRESQARISGTTIIAELIRNMEHRADILDMLRKKGEASWMREKISHLVPPAVDAAQAAPAA